MDNVIGARACLNTKEEIFLLSLCLEAPERPNLDSICQLEHYYGKLVSTGFILTWFKKKSVPQFVSKTKPYPLG
jgi:hypothetical protein